MVEWLAKGKLTIFTSLVNFLDRHIQRLENMSSETPGCSTLHFKAVRVSRISLSTNLKQSASRYFLKIGWDIGNDLEDLS